MTDVKLTAPLLALWLVFSLLFFTKSLINYSDELVKLREEKNSNLHSNIARLRIYIILVSLVGLLGTFSFAGLIGHFDQFKSPLFFVGACSGIVLFFLTYFIGRKP